MARTNLPDGAGGASTVASEDESVGLLDLSTRRDAGDAGDAADDGPRTADGDDGDSDGDGDYIASSEGSSLLSTAARAAPPSRISTVTLEDDSGGGGGRGGGGGGGTNGSALRTPHTPRTPNRVRFDLRPQVVAPANGHARASIEGQGNGHDDAGGRAGADDGDDGYESDDGDSLDVDGAPENGGRGGGGGGGGRMGRMERQHRMPLLTGVEAPSVALARAGEATIDGEDVEDWAEQQRARPKSGLRSAFMNMANSIIGAGIIGQPYALRQAGLVAGVVLLVVLTVAVDWTIRLIVVNSKLSGASSFQGTVEHCFGRSGLIAISLAQWVFAFGGMVAFGVIVGDSIPHVLTAVWPGLPQVPVLGLLADRRAVIVVCILAVSYPLTLYRDIAKLAKASTFALISMMVILVTVVIQGALVPSTDRGSFSVPLLTVNSGIFQAIGVISFAFVCHHNSLLIYGSLKTPTIDRFSRVTHFSTAVSMVACLLMAVAGFLTFGDRTLGNVLNNFPSDNTMVNVARLCFGLNMLTTLPLEAFVCREVMFNYYFPGEPFNMHLHLMFSTGLVVGAMSLSLITCDLGAIFELVGATSACAMAYILPPLCYMKLTTRSWRTYVAAGVVVFGCTVMGISLLQAVGKMIRGEGGTAQCR